MALIAVRELKKSFVTQLLFENVSFEIGPRDKVGLVGVNGAGKTTLARIITGEETADEGNVYRTKDARIVTMAQTLENTDRSVLEEALTVFSELIRMEAELEKLSSLMQTDTGDLEQYINRSASLRDRYEMLGGLTYTSRTRSALLGLGFDDEELNKPLSLMSGGQRNKVQLAKVLLSGAELLILDEPTNHLDIDSVIWLEDFLRSYSGAFVVISHDRYFLDRVTNRTVEIMNKKAFVSDGNYSRHLELKSSEQESIRRRYMNTQREIRRVQGIVEQQRRFGQERNFITAASKLKQIERLKATLVAPEKETDGIRFGFEAKKIPGNDVLMCEGLRKAYDRLLFSGVDIHIRKGERVFLLGANGCGKTTLLKIITGKEYPDAGTVRLGAKVETGYYEQTMTGLDADETVLGEIRNAYPFMTDTQIRTALGAFLFRGDDVLKRIEMLSGGERARVQLLKLMLSGTNLLLLDEPTNHLDIASRDALERALESYDGTMLIVTHDRYLVNRLADRVIYMDECGVTEYIGGYDDYLEAKAMRTLEEVHTHDTVKKPNEYRAGKERQSAINRARGEAARAEESLKKAESELEAINARLAEPSVATDYTKSIEYSKKAEAKQLEIDSLYEKWLNAVQTLETLEAE